MIRKRGRGGMIGRRPTGRSVRWLRLGDSSLGRRHALIGLMTAGLFLVLVGRLWSLQVTGSAGYDDVVTDNRTRTVVVSGVRGRILDAKGRELALSEPVLAVTFDWQAMVNLSEERRNETWAQVEAELAAAGRKLTADDLEQQYQQSAGRDLQPTVIASAVEPDLWVALAERQFPGIGVEEQRRRRYPYQSGAAHVIGHLGTVSGPEEAAHLNVDTTTGEESYRPGDVVGRSGIEQRYEPELRGRSEIRRVEVDALGRVIRTLEVLQEARPGRDVQLTIDLDLQLAAERAMVSQLRLARERSPGCDGCPPQRAEAGSVVALRPSDGSVVAMASYPAFDPNWFVGGGNDEVLAAVLNDSARPLLNRAIAGQYPPGSTFKPVVAYTSVTSGFRAPEEQWNDVGHHVVANCSPAGAAGCLFNNAGNVVMGEVDLTAALARSSDTYFYSIGDGLWSGRRQFGSTPIQDTALSWGLGVRSGLALAGEASGLVPLPAGRDWFAGDNINLSIGQGDLLVTPIQLANVYATIAANGQRPIPNVVRGLRSPVSGVLVVESVRSVAQPNLDPVARHAIEAGLTTATVSGTAASAFAGFPLATHPIAGKTGTAQVDGKADLSLFAAYGSPTDLDLAVVVVLEEAGWGATAAAPVARGIFDAALAGTEWR